MRLVVFGLTVGSSWGNGHATPWRGLAAALGRAGHALHFFEKDQPWFAAHRDVTALAGGTELCGAFEEVLVARCEEAMHPHRELDPAHEADPYGELDRDLDLDPDPDPDHDLDRDLDLDRGPAKSARLGERSVDPRGAA